MFTTLYVGLTNEFTVWSLTYYHYVTYRVAQRVPGSSSSYTYSDYRERSAAFAAVGVPNA